MKRGVYLIPMATDGEKEVETSAKIKLEDLLNTISEAVADYIASAVITSTMKGQEETYEN